ncbi:MAG: hypothetical protein AAB442_03515 [Patescibacteria group bacterium]
MWVKSSSAPRGNDRFETRRRLRRRRIGIATGFLLLLLLATALYELNQDFVRIKRVQIVGADQSLADLVTPLLTGSFLGLIPHDSILFFPAGKIRAALLDHHPQIATVSLSRDGLTGLTVEIQNRIPIAQWCGETSLAHTLASSSPTVIEDCYFFDASGVIFGTTTSEQVVNSFTFYEPHPAAAAVQSYIGTTLPSADLLPAAFDFARQLAAFGSPVRAIIFRDGEVDNLLENGTRVTYVLGDEQSAFTTLTSARGQIPIQEGTVEYVDLRFDGRVYFREKK